MSLPYVLAGPMLRRTSQDEVCVWLALSAPIGREEGTSLDLEIYDAQKIPSWDAAARSRQKSALGSNYATSSATAAAKKVDREEPVLDGRFTHIRVADKLHVYLVHAVPASGRFPVERVLAYEIFVVESKGNAGPARRFGLCEHLRRGLSRAKRDKHIPVYQRGYSDDPSLSARGKLPAGAQAISFPAEWRPNPLIRLHYGGGQDHAAYHYELPTFLLQGTGELRVWAGSCAKSHAAPLSATLLMYDAQAPSADKAGLLALGAYNGQQRPHALLLIGDQIYADDVPFYFVPRIRALRHMFDGDDELIPLDEPTRLDTMNAQLRRVLFGSGTETPFSLEEGVENQLISAMEFATYYLMLFNPALWPQIESERSGADGEARKLRTLYDRQRIRRLDVEASRLKQNLRAFHSYATVLANVPIYCICDDHEVTDDWFFDATWIDRIQPSGQQKKRDAAGISAIGQYVVASGLYAYAVFQGLGNMAAHAAQPIVGALVRPDEKNYRQMLTRLLAAQWSYTLPTSPTIVVLDTRTKRVGYSTPDCSLAKKVVDYSYAEDDGFGTERRDAAQLLMSTPQAIREALSGGVYGDRQLLLVTPSPLLSSDGIEIHAKNLPFSRDPHVIDDELWRSNYSSYFMLIKEFADLNIKTCTVISGDLHYGYRRHASLKKVSAHSTLPYVEIEQIVSSPLLNAFEKSYGSGPSSLLKMAESFFKRDYGIEKVFWRSKGNLFDKQGENAWVVSRVGGRAAPPAHEVIQETLTPVACNMADGASEDGMIFRNHFVELWIAQGKPIGVLFHQVVQ